MYSELVGEEGICGRFNADQFACLLEHQEYTDQLFVQAEAQLNALSNTKSVVVKWGIYPVRDRATSVEQMCDRAFLAAHSIKGQYAKHFAVYDDNLRNKLLREQAITDSMEKALAEKQFFIYLQPKYTIQDDRLAGAESLVRWNHPEWGLQSPAVFIPLFERNGFITRLDQYVWDKVCAVMQSWKNRGLPPLPVSVNVSRADIYNADLTAVLMGLLQKYELPPASLHLEITESAYTENPRQIIETVSHLRELGFVVEMDFGAVAQGAGRGAKAGQPHQPAIGREQRSRQGQHIAALHIRHIQPLQVDGGTVAGFRHFYGFPVALQAAGSGSEFFREQFQRVAHFDRA